MKHRIVVLGAGYAGAFAAGTLARKLHPDDFQITVVNAEPDFVERLRLHQLAAGRPLRHRPLARVFAGTGIELRVARVRALDVERRTVTVAGQDGVDELGYDTLLYALGSSADETVPGVAEHTFPVAARESALGLRARLDKLADGGKVLVVGGNLTAIETVTELAEARPGLRVALATSGELGGWLGASARGQLLRAVDRFGITLHEHTTVARVEPGAAIAADGTALRADAIVWAAGFAVSPIAAASGLAVVPDGRIRVDRQMRSVSHPEVYVAGDSVFVLGENGLPLPMSCASAGFTGMQATAAIVGDRTGRSISTTALSYVGNHISLGRKDAIFQLVDGAAQARSWALRGRMAARIKAAILDLSGWSVSHPTFGKLDRRYRAVTAPAPEMALG
ncbi:NAD(P)/FAD-dependent oxidoreductase [Nocardia rhizosphaerae]|uniref:NAD(P)/FAD-dependent oxidoreductase n=1 Tax=Nocardia rhizosphaerae TaxID=1691571 RepID=A0ABV8L7G2_9NOCA